MPFVGFFVGERDGENEFLGRIGYYRYSEIDLARWSFARVVREEDFKKEVQRILEARDEVFMPNDEYINSEGEFQIWCCGGVIETLGGGTLELLRGS